MDVGLCSTCTILYCPCQPIPVRTDRKTKCSDKSAIFQSIHTETQNCYSIPILYCSTVFNRITESLKNVVLPPALGVVDRKPWLLRCSSATSLLDAELCVNRTRAAWPAPQYNFWYAVQHQVRHQLSQSLRSDNDVTFNDNTNANANAKAKANANANANAKAKANANAKSQTQLAIEVSAVDGATLIELGPTPPSAPLETPLQTKSPPKATKVPPEATTAAAATAKKSRMKDKLRNKLKKRRSKAQAANLQVGRLEEGPKSSTNDVPTLHSTSSRSISKVHARHRYFLILFSVFDSQIALHVLGRWRKVPLLFQINRWA